MIVADSSVWIDYGRGAMTRQTRVLLEAIAQKQALAADLIVAEVLQGITQERQFKATLDAFDELPQATIGGRDIAVAAARNYLTLRAAGVTPRGTIDVFIATFCIENDHILLHADRDFDAMEKHLGLRTV